MSTIDRKAFEERLAAILAKANADDVTELKQAVSEAKAADREHTDAKSLIADDGRYAKVLANMGTFAHAEDDTGTKSASTTGGNRLAFSKADLKRAHDVVRSGGNAVVKAVTGATTKDFSTVSPLLPPQLAPGVVEHIHENRLMDRLPVTAISAPSYEFVVHNFAGDTGGPDWTAEGAGKPEWVPDVTTQTVTAKKLAVHFATTYESNSDFPEWTSYLQVEGFNLFSDKENQALLYGDGTGSSIKGFAHTSGILTHDASADTSGWTLIDSIEDSITTLRSGTSLSEPNLFVTSPATWSAIRRTKSTTNKYIVGDPLESAVSSIWGIPVVVTTAVTDGEAFLIDTARFGSVLVREGIVMYTGYSGTDFTDNVARTVLEERIALAVNRPQSILHLTGLTA